MKNYAKTNIGNEGRVELHDALSLTGAEVSINALPPALVFPSFTPTRRTKKSTESFQCTEKQSSTGKKSPLPQGIG